MPPPVSAQWNGRRTNKQKPKLMSSDGAETKTQRNLGSTQTGLLRRNRRGRGFSALRDGKRSYSDQINDCGFVENKLQGVLKRMNSIGENRHRGGPRLCEEWTCANQWKHTAVDFLGCHYHHCSIDCRTGVIVGFVSVWCRLLFSWHKSHISQAEDKHDCTLQFSKMFCFAIYLDLERSALHDLYISEKTCWRHWSLSADFCVHLFFFF